MRIPAILAVAVVCLAAALPARADSFSSVVVYGDSLSDNGNLYKLTGGIAPASPPYYMGRFSNGPVAVEQLAAQLNAPLFDFAVGGATTGIGNVGDYGTQTQTGFFGLPGMTEELAASAAKLPTALVPSSLFVVWGGANDYESLLNPGAPTPTVAEAQATAKAAAANVAGLVATLQMYGAQSILVPNLPNLAATPELQGSATAAAYTTEFNADLAADLSPGVTLFDTNALLSSIVSDPGKYNLSNVTAPCLNTTNGTVCADPSQYLFWDNLHPTTAVDAILAKDFAAAVTPAVAATPEPSSLLLLGTGLVSATGLLFRRRAA